jgi:uncharacterized Zn-binding protein involved in type VI secretion
MPGMITVMSKGNGVNSDGPFKIFCTKGVSTVKVNGMKACVMNTQFQTTSPKARKGIFLKGYGNITINGMSVSKQFPMPKTRYMGMSSKTLNIKPFVKIVNMPFM